MPSMSSESELDVELRSMANELISRIFAGAIPLGNGRFVVRIPLGADEFEGKVGLPPASKSAIAAIPVVKITTAEEGGECAICLNEYGTEDEVKETPCKHRYHSGCIDKWLGIHGSCPICRYEMPFDAEEEERQDPVVAEVIFVVALELEPIPGDSNGEPEGIESGDNGENPGSR